MQAEMVAFWGFICLLLIALAEFKRDFVLLGVIGCLLLVPLAFWVWTDGIEIQTGQITTITTVQNTTLSGSTTTGSETDTNSYLKLSRPYFDPSQTVSGVLLGCSLLGVVHYASSVKPIIFGNSTMG